MSSDGITWEEPPPPANGKWGKTQHFVEALKQRPGQWARYPGSYKQGASVTVNRTRFPGTEWTARKQPDGSYHIWGRWVGDNDA